MTIYKHIVQVHPVENGLPNLYKVRAEHEFDTKEVADVWIRIHNNLTFAYGEEVSQAVYVGRVNTATGELE